MPTLKNWQCGGMLCSVCPVPLLIKDTKGDSYFVARKLMFQCPVPPAAILLLHAFFLRELTLLMFWNVKGQQKKFQSASKCNLFHLLCNSKHFYMDSLTDKEAIRKDKRRRKNKIITDH
jgi:hypothetical protein